MGCAVEDSDATSTTSDCTTATATDVWITCPPTEACSTTSTSVTTGCGATPTTFQCSRTTTISGDPTQAANIAVRQDEGDEVCEVQNNEYVIIPANPENSAETSAIAAALEIMVGEGRTTTSTANGIGVVYWTAPITFDQANELRERADVS